MLKDLVKEIIGTVGGIGVFILIVAFLSRVPKFKRKTVWKTQKTSNEDVKQKGQVEAQ